MQPSPHQQVSRVKGVHAQWGFSGRFVQFSGKQKDTECYFAGTATTEELQNALIPLELSKIEVVTPPALAEDGAPRELGEHEAPDSTDPEKMSDEDGLMGVTTKDGPEDLPVKEYLDATVVPVLRDGLRILAKERWARHPIPSYMYIYSGKHEMASQEVTCRTWLESEAVGAVMRTGQWIPTPSWETTSRHTGRRLEFALCLQIRKRENVITYTYLDIIRKCNRNEGLETWEHLRVKDSSQELIPPYMGAMQCMHGYMLPTEMYRSDPSICLPIPSTLCNCFAPVCTV